MSDIFEYTDFRAYLKDYYLEKKEKNPRFSYETWTQKVGFTNRGFLYSVLHGSKKLSKLHCHKLSQALKHTKTEAQYFECIVFYTQEENQENRTVFLQQAFQCKCGVASPSHLIRKDQYEYLSRWYHSVIRALIEVQPFKDDYEQLARRITPSVTAAQVKKSIRLLERLNLIVKNDDHTWHVTDKSLKAGEELSQTAKTGFHLECNNLARKSILNFTPEKQHVSSLVLGISEQTFEQICKETRSFKNRIIELANNDKTADMVYQYQLTFFPVTKEDATDLKGGRSNEITD
jgi:uncharacterized protein (TIGR02147 family)